MSRHQQTAMHKIAPFHQRDTLLITKDNPMWLRRLLACFGLLGILYSGFAMAMGLGEISLNSQYNEPLDAEIRLLKVRDLGEQEILVSLASREDFRRAGVERPFFLNSLRFDISLTDPNNPVIRVTSPRPVTEPYLNFLIDVQWPSGRLVREYTLLLDLPVFSEQPSTSSPVAAPSAATPTPVPSAPSVSSTVSAPPPTVSASPPRAEPVRPAPVTNPVEDYRVRSGDTLWEIAEKTRSDRSLSVSQAMVAIQRANPEAFIDSNINLLKNGRVLRIPDASEVRQITAVEADNIVQQQTRSWRNQRSQQQAPLTTASAAPSAPTTSTQPEGRLTLGSADTGATDVSGVGTSGGGEALQNELAIAQEELDRTTRENSELKSRVEELEAQIQTMEELVKVTNEQMRALEIAINTDSETPSPEPVAPADSGIVQQEPVPELAVEPIPEPIIEPIPEPVPSPIPDPIPEPIAIEPVPVEEPQSSASSGIVDVIKQNLIAILGGLAALLLVILLIMKFREKPVKDEDFDKFDMAEGDSPFDDDNTEALANVAIDDDFVETDLPGDAFAESVGTVEAQTEDVVAEADIYISLGQHNKAIELLEREVQQNPDNADAHLGLLKIHASNNDPHAFDAQYSQLLPLGNAYAIDQANALRGNMSDIAPFDTDTSVDEEALDLNLDFDEGLDDSDLSLLDEAADDVTQIRESISVETESSDDIDLDFELPDMGDDLDQDLSVDKIEESIGDLDLDLDGLGDLEIDLESSSDFAESQGFEAAPTVVESAAEPKPAQLEDTIDLENSIILESDAEESIDDITADIELDLGDDIERDAGDDINLELDGDFSSDEVLNLLDDPEAESIIEEAEASVGDLQVDLEDTMETFSADTELPELDLDLDIEDDLNLEDGFDGDIDLDLEEPKAADIAAAHEEEIPEPELNDAEDEALDDLDIDSLDREIDEMTANFDDVSVPELSEEAVEEIVEAVDDIPVPDTVEDSAMQDEPEEISFDSLDDVDFSEDSDLGFLDDTDEVATKLDLARAYLDMGDHEGAQDILNEVVEEGNEVQQAEAKGLLEKL